jgi:hypothetical protein
VDNGFIPKGQFAGASSKDSQVGSDPIAALSLGMAENPLNQTLLGDIGSRIASNDNPLLFNQTSKGDFPAVQKFFNEQVRNAGGWPGGNNDVTSNEAAAFIKSLMDYFGHKQSAGPLDMLAQAE